MKNKFGFNLIFAIIAFPIAMALVKDTNFENLTFRKPALDILYLITFIALMFLMLKKQSKNRIDTDSLAQ